VCLNRYGYFATNNRYYFCYNPKTLESIFTEIRNGGKYCDHVGPYKVADALGFGDDFF
jgi:phosphoglucomutase